MTLYLIKLAILLFSISIKSQAKKLIVMTKGELLIAQEYRLNNNRITSLYM